MIYCLRGNLNNYDEMRIRFILKIQMFLITLNL